jgi:hypothetical protein
MARSEGGMSASPERRSRWAPPAALAAALLVAIAALVGVGRKDSQGETDNAWHPGSRPALVLQGWLSGDSAPSSPGYWVLDGASRQGLRRYRTRVRLDAPADSLEPLFLRHAALPRAQAYWWDGDAIGRNGRISADGSGEEPGRLMATVRIPPRLAGAGLHTLEVAVSNHGPFTGGLGEIRLGTLRALQRDQHGENALTAFLAGIFVITAVFQFVNFLSSIRRGYALFSIFCLGCVLQILPLRLGMYLGGDTDDLQALIVAGTAGWCIMMTTLPLFFFGEFTAIGRPRLLLVAALSAAPALALAAAAAGLLPPGGLAPTFLANSLLGFLTVAASLAAAAWGMRRKRPGAFSAALGLLCVLAGVAGSHALDSDAPWGMGLAALILFQHASLSRLWQGRGLEQKEIQLRASRLEIELLKKNIQPHFLLHSLRSITDLLLKDPRAAARLVNALAGELRMMLKITHEKVIPLAEEIRLCRSHLEVLSLRGGMDLALDEEGDVGAWKNLEIPPMVLHTLLEQGLEAADPSARSIRFRLEVASGKDLTLRLSHDAPLRPASAFPIDDTGFLYARARLEEAYPGRWRLDTHQSDASTAWLAEITLLESQKPTRTVPT